MNCFSNCLIDNFNNLVDQFKNNKRYLSLSDQSIAEDVNIQFEQFVNKKTFDAIFYQKPETDRLDKNKIQEQVMKELLTIIFILFEITLIQPPRTLTKNCFTFEISSTK